MSSDFSSWLRGLDVDQLAALLRARPDALALPVPATPEDLADRLSSDRSLERVLPHIDTAALQLTEVLAALDGEASPDELLRRIAIDDPADAAAVELTLRELTTRGLVIEHHGRLRLVGALRTAWPRPLGMGEALLPRLQELPASWTEQIAGTLGVRKAGSGRKTATAVAAHLSHDRIRELLAHAPADARDLLTAALTAHEGLPAPDGTIYSLLPSSWRRQSPYTWLLDRALLLPADPFTLEVPREVALALLGEEWALRLPLHPPEIVTTPVPGDAVERESAAAVGAVLATTTDLLEHLAVRPATALKTGGLGIREVRRLAKALHRDEQQVELAAHLAGGAGLVASHGGNVLPTATYDDWRATEPARRLVSLVTGWWDFPAAVTGRTDDAGKPEPALARVRADPGAVALRRDLLAALVELPDGRGATAIDTVVARMLWQHPMGYLSPTGQPCDRLAGATWRELEQLGLAAHGRASQLGRALLAGDENALLARAQTLLPPAVEVIVLQADLTAVVAGSPSADVAALLDEAADREVRGNASVWRFSPASVRRVLDAGGDAEQLLQRLAALSNADLPQPLAYLIRDVARRHGHLAVAPLSCAVVSDDQALLAEVAVTRSLRPLAPRLLAPTVLASAKPVDETVRRLREAGYAPVQQDTEGHVVLERARRQRAVPHERGAGGPARGLASVPGARRPARARFAAPDADEVARRILAAPPPASTSRRAGSARPGVRAGAVARDARQRFVAITPTAQERFDIGISSAEQIAAMATRLSPDEVALLTHAVETGDAVAIDYVDSNGKQTHRVVSDCELDPPFLAAWCHLREDERIFTISHVSAVSPAL